jgi:hypothetical protein
MIGRAVSGYFGPAPMDADPIERADATRSEALALVDRFWEEVEACRAGAFEPGSEITLSFSRDLENDFIEFSMFDPPDFGARHHYVRAWKLFGFIPLRTPSDYALVFSRREEVADLVEAYMTAPDPARFGDHMLRLGATKPRRN